MHVVHNRWETLLRQDQEMSATEVAFIVKETSKFIFKPADVTLPRLKVLLFKSKGSQCKGYIARGIIEKQIIQSRRSRRRKWRIGCVVVGHDESARH